MDKIFNSTFDFFTYAVPGACILFSVFILDQSIATPKDFIGLTSKMNLSTGVMILIVGYTLGFAVYPIGRWFRKRKIFNRVFKGNFEDPKPELSISDKYILIREFSDANFKYVERWNMYSAMAHNLAVSTLMVLLFVVYRLLFLPTNNNWQWWLFALGAAVLFILFISRSVVFSKWAAVDINSSVHLLNLEKQAQNFRS